MWANWLVESPKRLNTACVWATNEKNQTVRTNIRYLLTLLDTLRERIARHSVRARAISVVLGDSEARNERQQVCLYACEFARELLHIA